MAHGALRPLYRAVTKGTQGEEFVMVFCFSSLLGPLAARGCSPGAFPAARPRLGEFIHVGMCSRSLGCRGSVPGETAALLSLIAAKSPSATSAKLPLMHEMESAEHRAEGILLSMRRKLLSLVGNKTFRLKISK